VQVHSNEGVANRIGPEPCAVTREGGGEASAGGRAGQPLSRERKVVSGADAVAKAEGQSHCWIFRPPSARNAANLAARLSNRLRQALDVANRRAAAIAKVSVDEWREGGLHLVVQRRFPVACVLEVAHDVGETVDVVGGLQAG
jgi:hypothetical protein